MAPMLNATRVLLRLPALLLLLTVLHAPGQALTATSVTLAVSTNTLPGGQTVAILTASVTSGSTPLTLGEVEFRDGARPLGKAQVVSSSAAGKTPGTATLPRLLGPGQHLLCATFRGTLTLAQSTSNTVPLSVNGTQSNGPDLFIAGNYPLSGLATSITVADVNGDGLPDVVVPLLSTPNTLLFLNDPNHPGHLLPPVTLQGPFSAALLQAVVADLNGDGLADILVPIQEEDTVDGNSVSIAYCFYQNPAAPGTFLPAVLFNTGVTVPGAAFAEDMDRDGVLDVVFTGDFQLEDGSYGHSAGVIFHPATGYPVEPAVQFNWYAPGSGTTGAAIADFNGDGLPDIAFNAVDSQTTAQEIQVFQSNPANPGGFVDGGSFVVPDNINYQVKAFDLDEDGHPDLLLGGTSAGLLWMRNDPANPGSFLTPVAFPVFGYAEGMDFGDLNGDGSPDVVIGSGSPAFSVLYGNGAGALGSPNVYSANPAGGEVDQVAVADMDGDGLDDVVSLTGLFNYVTAPTFQLNVSTHANPGTRQPPAILLQTPANGGASLGSPLSLTAVLSSPLGTPTGVVNFLLNGVVVGSATVAPDGTATLTTTSLPAGDDTIVAQYQGDATFALANSNVVPVSIQGLAPIISFTASPSTGSTVTLFTFTVKVTGSPGGPMPTGTVHFIGASGLSVSTATLDATGSATYSAGGLPQGVQTLAAAYLGDTTYAPAYASTTITVTAGPSLTLSSSSPFGVNLTAGTAVTLTAVLSNLASPAGQTIAFLDNGTPVYTATTDATGTAVWSNAVLPVGTNQLTAQYTAPGGSVTSYVTPITVDGIETAISLTASPAAPSSGQAVTVTAVVKPASGTVTPTGSVSFTEDSASLGTATLDPTGTASITLGAQTAGTHILSTIYGGSSLFASSTDTLPLTVTAVPADFSLSLSQTAVILTPGATASLTVSAIPAGGFSDTVALSCTGLPAGDSCSFAPATLTVGTNAAQSTLTFTAASTTASLRPAQAGKTRWLAASLMCFALPCIWGLRRRKYRFLAVVAAAAAMAGSLTGCGSNGAASTPPQPSPTTFTIQVAAQGQKSAITHNTSLTVTVQ